MDYLKFHQLEREPFQNALDTRFYFESSPHARVRMRLERGLTQHRSLLALVGEPGCGKSTLAHQLAHGLDAGRFLAQLRVIPHAACASGWLLPKVAQAFGAVEPSMDPVRLIEQIHHALLVAHSRGRHPVLIVDEAQMLETPDVMREFRGLLNLLEDGQPLLSIVLCGLLELDRVLQLDPSLAQRVEVRCTLGALVPDEVAAYVAHRLSCAGATGPVFVDDAVGALAEYGSGIPRLINTLADNALFESAVLGARPATLECVIAAADQLGLVRTGPPQSAPRVAPVPSAAPRTRERPPAAEPLRTATPAPAPRAAAAPTPPAARPAPVPPRTAPQPRVIRPAAAPAAAAPAPAPAARVAPSRAPRPAQPQPAPERAPAFGIRMAQSPGPARDEAVEEAVLTFDDPADDPGVFELTDAFGNSVETVSVVEEGNGLLNGALLSVGEDVGGADVAAPEQSQAALGSSDDSFDDLAGILEFEEEEAAPAAQTPVAAAAPEPDPAADLDALFAQIQRDE